MEYNFQEIEARWRKQWAEMKTYHVEADGSKPKYYVLNMFPYPSGAGLHVGHPLGYIASDIYARYKRLKGFNVLNPMGYDAYGLPAEQYAIQTGQHPEVTTNANIARYREQLDKIGFSFDWDREVRTCAPDYYKWTQWAFQKMFNSFFCNACQSAQPIEELINHFEKYGTEGRQAACSEELSFTAEEWKAMTPKEQSDVLMNYRIAFMGETMVNWCPELGTVLANDEVVNGVSERGGYPVEQKKMRQWCLRVSAYSQRLLDGLDNIQWSESIKETQRNWIGRSEGTEMRFQVKKTTDRSATQGDACQSKNRQQTALNSPLGDARRRLPEQELSTDSFTIFTTRADTIFGVTFMVLAPESELVQQLTTENQREEVEAYVKYVKGRTERERMIDHKVTGVFSGSYAINPFTGAEIPIWISEYVLSGYGTGAIMAVPAHDSRDYAFARHFNLPIIPLIEGADVSEESFDAKEGIVMNSPRTPSAPNGGTSPLMGRNTQEGLNGEKQAEVSLTAVCSGPFPQQGRGGGAGERLGEVAEGRRGFSLNGLTVKEAIAATKKFVTEQKLGRVKVNYRLRDAIFSRQRYWGEPFPVYYKEGVPTMVPEECLPVLLPEVADFKPTKTGEPPLGNAQLWAWDEVNRCIVDKDLIDEKTVFPLELFTMPGFAGSSAYYLRYMDPHNDKALISEEAADYWKSVDLYVGGSEHATGHLIYSRFWNKFLFDLGVSKSEEPFQRLVNQGMIQGWSSFVHRVKNTNKYVSFDLLEERLSDDKKTKRYFYEGTETDPIHADISLVSGTQLNVEGMRQWRPEFADAEFVLNADGQYIVSQAVEKMSKSKYNVVNPDDICEKYGADTLRLYEMFLGPVEQSKPWDVAGIDGCFRFLKKAWALFDKALESPATDATKDNLKTLHKLIKKVSEDIEVFSYNTSVPAFMVAVGELQQQKCQSREVLETLAVLLAPFCPHFAEEVWHRMGHDTSVCDAQWPAWNEEYMKESAVTLGVQFNGKVRFSMDFPVDATSPQMQEMAKAAPEAQKYLEGMQIVKIVAVPGRIVNFVVKPA